MDPDNITHKNHIGTRYLDSKLPIHTKGCKAYGWKPLHNEGRRLPVPQVFPKSRSYTNALYDKRMLDIVACITGTIYVMARVIQEGESDK